jgi:phosphoribosylformylglycinamidine synthase
VRRAVIPYIGRGVRGISLMKAKIIVMPKKTVLDPQGATVKNALTQMSFGGIQSVRVGKFIEIEIADGNKDEARKKLDDACHRLLSNPVIEDYQLEING